jgi:hypothetical protein
LGAFVSVVGAGVSTFFVDVRPPVTKKLFSDNTALSIALIIRVLTGALVFLINILANIYFLTYFLKKGIVNIPLRLTIYHMYQRLYKLI